MKITVNGTQLIVLAIVIAVIIYWIFRMRQEAVLPPKDILVRMIAAWAFNAGYGNLDYTRSEVEVVGEKRAYAYFPDVEKTFEFVAGMGVMGERWRDIESHLYHKEKSDIVRSYAKTTAAADKRRGSLHDQGFETS